MPDPIHRSPPIILTRPQIVPGQHTSAHAEYDANGNIIRARATADHRQLELVVSGETPTLTATFSEDSAGFLSVATRLQKLGIRDPVDPVWANRHLFLLDLSSPHCWLRYELIPVEHGKDNTLRPLAASRSVLGPRGWSIVDAATGHID